MKILSFHSVPKLERNLTWGGGKSPPLPVNSTLLGSLDLLNPFRWFRSRLTQRPLVQLPVDLFTLIVCITLVLESSPVWAAPVYNSANDHYYEAVNTGFTFDNAVANAASRTYLGRPGRLLTINDAAEQSFIQASLSLGAWGVYWIAGKRVSSVNQWITNEPFTYTNWISGYPNSSDYGFSIGGSGYAYQWGSQISTTVLGDYIVEYISLQSITFTPPTSGTYGGSATLSATGGGSGNAVTFSSTTSVCTVSGSTVNYVGVGTCTVKADQAGNVNYNAATQASGNITITNTAPTANNGTLTTNEDTAGSGTLSASDADGNVLTYSLVANGSKGSVTITSSTGAYTYTPNLNQNGSDTFTFSANDGLSNSNTATITVTITPVNDAPVITQGASTSVTMSEDGSPTAWSTPTISATDVDGDTLTWSLNTAASYGTATVSGTGASPTLTYVPTTNYNGSDSFVVKVSDGSLTATITVNVTITAVNDAPVATAGTLTTDEDTAGSGTLSATDAEANSLTYSLVANGSKGTATITNTSTGAYTYTPNLNQNGTDTFTFKANDGTVDSNTATVTVTISAVNDAPVATAGTLTTDEDTAGSGTLSASDADGNALTYSIVTNGTKGSATITNTSTGAYTYTPNLNQNGSDTFTFKVNDGTVDSNTATMTVTINAVNDIPTLTLFSAPLDTTAEDTEVELTFAELTTQGDESDSADAINGGAVTSFMVQTISTGTLKIGANAGTATAYAAGTNEIIDATHLAYWTPALNENGTLNAFTVKAKDNSGALSSTAVQVTVTVTAVNNAPIITGQNPLTTNEDTALTVALADVLVTDVDNIYPTDFSLTVNSGSNYTVSGTTITPSADFNGTLTVPVKVNDGALDSNLFNLTVTVAAVNDAPIITGQNPLTTSEDTALTVALADVLVTDVDNIYPTSFSLTVNSGSNYTVSGTTITPSADFNGTLTVPVKVNDGGLDSNIFNLTVTVTAVNDVPVATAGTLTTLEDTVGNGTVSGTDIENSPLTYTVVTNGTKGTVVITANTGAYTYTPNTNLNGSDTFTFKANDGTADSTPATVTVTITPVNDLPTFTATDPPAVLENTGTHTLSNWATFSPGPADETDNVLTYTVSNVSNPTLFASLPSVDTTGTLTYTLATNQSGTSTIEVTVQDTGGTANGGNDLSIASQFTLGVSKPELQVRQNTTVQVNGSVYDFGPVLITQSSPVITFTVDNLGTSDLFLTGTPKLTVTGEAATDFKVVDQTTNTIAPGDSSTFNVVFVPSVMEIRTATLTLVSNDSDETTNTLILRGQGLTPNVKVFQGPTEIPMGEHFDIGLVGIDHTVSYPFTIENVGNSDLRLTGAGTPLFLNGTSVSEFNVDTSMTQTVLKVGEKTTFLLNLTPVEVGTKTVTLSLPNNDLEQGNYSFTVTAQGILSKYLRVILAGNGHGTVTSQLPNMNCLENLCQQPVIDFPQWVYLKALPDTGSAFMGWTGDPACQADGKVLILADTTCQATFELQNYEFLVGRFGQGKITGAGIDCPADCSEILPYGTTVQLEAVADHEWNHTGWKGSCDETGKVTVTNTQSCLAIFEPILDGPNMGDGNGDKIPDAHQPNVISLPDKISGKYVTFEVQPETCPIMDVYTDLPDNYGEPDKNKPLPQGLIYFELGCSQAQISIYYHAVNVMRRNFIFQKFAPTVPGDENTFNWFTLPNVTFEVVKVGDKSVAKATYTLKDGELGDGTGVDGRIVDPGGLGLQ